MIEHTLLAFAPAVAYLLVVTVALVGWRRCPAWLHLAALGVGVPLRVLVDGWAQPFVSLAVGLVVFVLGVLVTSRLLTGVTLFSLCTALALLPFYAGWAGVLAGLALAAVVSVWRTVRAAGLDRVNLLAFETMSAVGVLPGGVLAKPDLDRLPTQDDLAAAPAGAAGRSAGTLYLPPYLLTGVLASGVLVALAGRG